MMWWKTAVGIAAILGLALAPGVGWPGGGQSVPAKAQGGDARDRAQGGGWPAAAARSGAGFRADEPGGSEAADLEVTISVDQMAAVEAFLQHLSAVGSPALREAIEAERTRLTLATAAGMTMTEARAYFMGYEIKLPLVVQ